MVGLVETMESYIVASKDSYIVGSLM